MSESGDRNNGGPGQVSPAAPPALTPPGLRGVAVFTPTWDETVDGFEELLRGDLDLRADAIAFRRARFRQFILWAILVALLVVALPAMLRRRIFPDRRIAAAVPAVGLVAYHVLTRPRLKDEVLIRARVRAAAWARLKYWALARPTEVGLCDAGLWMSTDRASTLIHWRGFARCTLVETAVVVATGRLEGHTVPVRAFGDRAAAQSFVAEVLAAQRRAGAHPDDLVAALFQSTGMRCPLCQYDLTGSRTAICPECGTNFDAEAEQRRQALSDDHSRRGTEKGLPP